MFFFLHECPNYSRICYAEEHQLLVNERSEVVGSEKFCGHFLYL